METRSSMSRSLHTNRDLEKLEPYEGKPSCTVLRGEEGSNALDLPDHLLLFSAGAYTLGAGLDATGLPGTLIDALFNNLGITAETPFWVLYLMLTAGMLLFSLVFQSKTMLTLIFVPIAIGVAQKNGYPVMSLAFPVAMLVGHVYVLPFNSKPAALLYTTNQYSWSDTFKFGITMMFISWLTIILWGETLLKWFGYTNGVFFGVNG